MWREKMFSLTLSPIVIALVAVLAPQAVALLTKQKASGGVKGTILTVLVALVTVGSTMIANEPVLTQEVLLNGLVAWVSAATGYTVLLKPSGVTAAIASKTSEKGVG